MADIVLESGAHSFEVFYQDELFEDRKRPAREIDESVFAPKKSKANQSSSDHIDHGYLD